MLSASEIRIGVVVSRNDYRRIMDIATEIYAPLLRRGCRESNITLKYVPSDFHLALGTLFFAEYTDVDAVIILMEPDNSPEYEAVLSGLTKLQIAWNMPITIGDCTAASEAIEMVAMQNEMEAAAPEHISPDRKSIN